MRLQSLSIGAKSKDDKCSKREPNSRLLQYATGRYLKCNDAKVITYAKLIAMFHLMTIKGIAP